MIGSLNSNNNGSIGNLGKKEVSRYNELARKIDEINTEIDDLESELAQIESSDTVDKEYGNIQSIQSSSIVNEDTITTDVIRARLAELAELQSNLIRTGSIEADNLYGQVKDVQNEATINTLHSNSIDANGITATNATIGNVELTNIDVDDVKADTAEIDSATIDNEQVNNSTITSANITTLESNAITSDSIVSNSLTSKTANVDEITTKEIVADEVKAAVIENSNLIGYNVISLGNLTPLDNDDDQQFYCLKLKKPFEKMTLKWPGSFECIIQSAMAEPETQVTHSASVIWLHQKQLNEVLRVSEDNEYVYIDVAPFNSNEDTRLYYKVEAKESLEDRITYSINEHPVYDFYYNPTRLSEVIIAGDGTEKYQLTVLGKLWAKISPDFENTVFEDITVNNNLYLKDFENTVSGDWEYKKGEVNDYLSNIENGIDEETGEQKTRIDWRKRVAFRNTNQYIVTTEDSKEDVLVDGTKIGERVVKANVNTLMDLGTLRNYNGQWITGEPTPATTYSFSFNKKGSVSDIITDIESFEIFGTPVIIESSGKTYPEEESSWKRWTFTPTDSYTIYTTTDLDNPILDKIKRFEVRSAVNGGVLTNDITLVPPNFAYKYLTEDVDYKIVPTSSIKPVTTINVEGMTEGEFNNKILATGLFEEINGELHPTQTIFLRAEYNDGAFDTDVYLSFREYDSYFSVFDGENEYTFSGDTVLSAIETTPATKANPITKLGTVDEGTWVAGDVTTPNLKVNDSTVLNTTTTINDDLHITEEVLDFGGTNYDVWDYANDNMNWVEE